MMTYKISNHEADWKQIRERVFIKEQGFQNEFDALDETSIHVVLYQDEACVGCGRVYPDEVEPTTWHLGRLAVLKEYRGQHMGVQLIHLLETEAVKHGANKIILSAQQHAIPFYEGCGYVGYGKLYMDEHVPHQAMKKNL